MEPVLITDQMITIKVCFNTNVCFVSTIYANCLYGRRKVLWASLVDLQRTILKPLIWDGDFNIIRYAEERGRGVSTSLGYEGVQQLY